VDDEQPTPGHDTVRQVARVFGSEQCFLQGKALAPGDFCTL
jgi:hypothetical protein